MAIEVFNRTEIKYMITDQQYEQILPIINLFMNPDTYNRGGKPYSICNLYLDTETDEMIRKSLEKPVYKEKLRLRSYGRASLDDTVYLEIKKKFKEVVNKRRTPFVLEEAYDFINDGKLPVSGKINYQVLNEIQYMMKKYKAYPKVFISYDRFAFFAKNDNDFRLTLDRNIRTRRYDVRLDSEIRGKEILPPGHWLMEAKAYKSFPLWFSHLLSDNGIYKVSFSKYGTEYKNYLKTKEKETIEIISNKVDLEENYEYSL